MWIFFWILAAGLFIFDIRLSRRPKEITQKESVLLCSFWVFMALSFGLVVGHVLGTEKMLEFYTGYLIEYTLSMDNMFVFLLIFSYFSIPKRYQPKILTWGILGAVVMRLIFIFAGVSLLNTFHWLIYVFGVILLISAIKMAVQKDEEVHPEKNPVLKLLGKFIPLDKKIEGPDFFVIKQKVIHATPLFAAVIVIETSDVVFAVDSIPAILAVTRDKFIIYTSNVFAVVGLRALYFFLSSLIDYFRFLKIGISVILFYVGVKMIISDFYHIPPLVSLSVITAIIAVSILLSVLVRGNGPRGKKEKTY